MTTSFDLEICKIIGSRQATVAIIGLGYVGLPLAVAFGEAGFRTICIDVNQGRVDAVNRGESYIQGISSERLAALTVVEPGQTVSTSKTDHVLQPKIFGTTDFDALDEANAVIVCVPTPLSKTKDPDVSYIVSVADEIAKHLNRGMLIVLESTTYPGTTEEIILPRLEQADINSSDQGPMKAGEDFYLAFSPERIDPGRTDWTVLNTPKVMGGVTSNCQKAAVALYSCALERIVPVSSPRVAETVKLLENTFRATNIALVNEFAIMCDYLGVDVWEVIDAAKTKPFGYMPFYPGPGLGGHCIPIDPQYLAWKLKSLDYTARFIQLAEEINFGMPEYWVTKVQDALNNERKAINGSSVLVLGVAYKADVDDLRESPALDILELLINKGAQVSYHDPNVPTLETDKYRLTSVESHALYEQLGCADCVIIATDHSSYDWMKISNSASPIVDTRNAIGKAKKSITDLRKLSSVLTDLS